MLSSHHGAGVGLAHGVGVAEVEALGGGGGAERLKEAVGRLLVLLAEQVAGAGSEGASGCEGTEAAGVSGLNHFLNRTRNRPRTHRIQKLIYWPRS